MGRGALLAALLCAVVGLALGDLTVNLRNFVCVTLPLLCASALHPPCYQCSVPEGVRRLMGCRLTSPALRSH
jgi:hypothetical protein